jgi:hypothetical protein
LEINKMAEFLTEAQLNTIVEDEYAGLPGIKDATMKRTVKTVIENTLKNLNEDFSAVKTGDADQYTPVIISLIRRTLPTLVGPQMVGMQAMNLPTGRIFVQRVYAVNGKTGARTEVWGGSGEARPSAPIDPNHSGMYETAYGESLGWKTADEFGALNRGNPYSEMAFGIESMDVSVQTRALKGRLTTEVMQDLRSVHGLDAQQEIASILQTEITAEIDREIVARIISEAKDGAQNCVNPGVFDFAVDADGRWSMEKIMGLLIQIEREATIIAQETRRGRGNFILTSPEVAASLSMANLITTDYQNTGFTPVVNPVGVSFYGMLCNRFKVFVDPYMTGEGPQGQLAHTVVVGYKGNSVYDAGIFYCPYIPVQWYSATGEEDFGLRLGIKSRYGLVSNPYSVKDLKAGNRADAKTNSFYRRFSVVL